MPKRVSILMAGVALALAFAACGGGGGTTNPPTTAPSATFTPNPKDTKATIEVTILQTPTPHIPVQISTPRSSSSPRPGTPFATQKTNYKGITIFRNLKPTKTYCFKALLPNNTTSSTCASWDVWQFQTIGLGT